MNAPYTPDCCSGPFPVGAEPIGMAILFTTGLTISLGHCLGMCGPLVTAYAVAQRPAGPDAGRGRFVMALARYHAGRILSYALIGGVLGLVGSASRLAGARLGIQGGLSLLAGLLMCVAGLGLLGLLPFQSGLERSPITRRVTARISALIRGRGARHQFAFGVANGFLPCGPVIAVALAAATAANPLLSMGAMVIYGLGTVPALVALGVGSHRIGAATRLRFFRVGAVLVVLVGFQLGLRGLGALGVVEHLEVGGVVVW